MLYHITVKLISSTVAPSGVKLAKITWPLVTDCWSKQLGWSSIRTLIITPSAELFIELQWVTFPESVHYHRALRYKSLTNLAPPYMVNMFQYVKDVGSTNLQSAANLKLYVPKTHLKSIYFSRPTIWNNLQPDARSPKSLCDFTQLHQKNQNIQRSYLWLHILYILCSLLCSMSIPCIRLCSLLCT